MNMSILFKISKSVYSLLVLLFMNYPKNPFTGLKIDVLMATILL